MVGAEGAKLLREIGGRISAVSKDPRELSWLRQRISIAIIRGNSAAILATAPSEYRHPEAADRRAAPDDQEPAGVAPDAEEHLSENTDRRQTALEDIQGGTFGLLIAHARTLSPSDFDIPWGDMFGARPKH